MDQAFLEFLAAAPLQVLLLAAIVVLWRENRRLNDKMDELYRQSRSNGAVLQDQNKDLEKITTHITGQTPPRGFQPPKLSDN